MNLGIMPSYNRTQINYTRKPKQNPSFGMAVKIDNDALPIIKKQVMSLPTPKKDDFWNKLNSIIQRQEENPVNIVVRKTTHRNALAADVIDSNPDTEIILNARKQGLFAKDGSLKFLEQAEEDANELNRTNKNIDKLPIAEEKDYYAGGTIPKEDGENIDSYYPETKDFHTCV